VIRSCDGTDPNLLRYVETAVPCDCGLIFDDVFRRVIYPHTQLLTAKQKAAIFAAYEHGGLDEVRRLVDGRFGNAERAG
jgi:hypothetical protein